MVSISDWFIRTRRRRRAIRLFDLSNPAESGVRRENLEGPRHEREEERIRLFDRSRRNPMVSSPRRGF
jgi:hypothetical protein